MNSGKRKPAIELVETRRDNAICETRPRYDVMLHGKKVGQLYWNMRGFVGDLPTPSGSSLWMPEGGISLFRKEAARLNREFATHVTEAVPCDVK